MNQKSNKIPLYQKVAYGSGAGGSAILSTVQSSFLLSYLSGTAGIAFAAISTMFVVCRVIDGVTDLCMGGIVDRTHTKIGKARPWLIIAAPLMCVGLILMFRINADWDDTVKLIYAYATYIFTNCLVYTILGVSHTALLARMSRDPKERNTTSTFSSLGNGIVGLVVSMVVSVLYLNIGWANTGIVLGIISLVLIILPGLLCKETVGVDEVVEDDGPGSAKYDTDVPLKTQLKVTFTNKYFWLAMLLGTILLILNAGVASFNIYYCSGVLGNANLMTPMLLFVQVPGLVMLLCMPYFVNRFSKRSFMLIGCGLIIIGSIVVGFANTSVAALFTGLAIRSLGVTPAFAGLYAFCADAADYGEWKTGIRCEGFMASSQSIGSKIGMGIGSALASGILGMAGYVEMAETQSQSAINAIRFGSGWMAAILGVLMIVCILLMDVEKYQPEIRAALGERGPKPPMAEEN